MQNKAELGKTMKIQLRIVDLENFVNSPDYMAYN